MRRETHAVLAMGGEGVKNIGHRDYLACFEDVAPCERLRVAGTIDALMVLVGDIFGDGDVLEEQVAVVGMALDDCIFFGAQAPWFVQNGFRNHYLADIMK